MAMWPCKGNEGTRAARLSPARRLRIPRPLARACSTVPGVVRHCARPADARFHCHICFALPSLLLSLRLT
eukprot:scaffold34819_cov147-Isochrysis_galbana.AAC.4